METIVKICIDTEQVRDIGRQFAAGRDRLTEIGHELQRTIGSLDT